MSITLKPAQDDIVARRPVWEGLSDLFLDTDTSLSRNWRVQNLSSSPYSIEELEFILVHEVYPICKYNFFSVAGVWSGFDISWLESKILKRINSPFRFFHSLSLGRIFVAKCSEWQATKSAIYSARYAKNAT